VLKVVERVYEYCTSNKRVEGLLIPKMFLPWFGLSQIGQRQAKHPAAGFWICAPSSSLDQ
jgi:hypothetical protein